MNEQDAYGFELIRKDPHLEPHTGFFLDLKNRIIETKKRILDQTGNLRDFASAHEYFGLHFVEKSKKDAAHWVLREWAPNATAIYLLGDFNGWQKNEDYRLEAIGHDQWELKLAEDRLKHGDLYKLQMEWYGGCGERLPAYVRRVVQDEQVYIPIHHQVINWAMAGNVGIEVDPENQPIIKHAPVN